MNASLIYPKIRQNNIYSYETWYKMHKNVIENFLEVLFYNLEKMTELDTHYVYINHQEIAKELRKYIYYTSYNRYKSFLV